MSEEKAVNSKVAASSDAGAVSDRDLLAACIRNDGAAWRELMARYDDALRAKVYKRCKPFLESIPNDYKDDIMGAFYLRLIDNDMSALRNFDWDKGTALFKWFARVAGQCAKVYLGAELDHGVNRTDLTEAMGLADNGGVLASGVRRFEGSLSARVRAEKAKAEKIEYLDRRRKRRRGRREASKRLAVIAA